LYLAELVFKKKECGVVEKHRLAEFGIVASALALLSSLHKDAITSLLENVGQLKYESPRPLVGCLYNRMVEKIAQPIDAIVPTSPSAGAFLRIRELVNRPDLWFAEMCNEILRIFSEPVNDWNLAISGLIVDVGIYRIR
jgi:hypothetical protein